MTRLDALPHNIRPDFTLNPDGLFTLTTDFTDKDNQEYKTQQLEGLKTLGAAIEEDEGIATASTQMQDFLKNANHETVHSFLCRLWAMSPDLDPYLDDPHTDDTTIDRVVNLSNSLTHEVSVNHHFQRWAETEDPLGGTVGKCAVRAMALPFKIDLDPEKDIVTYNFGHAHTIRGGDFSIDLRDHQFDVKQDTKKGTINLRRPLITTMGTNATWFTSGSETINVADNPTLYGINRHNHDTPKQTLSVLLGMASLAFYAAKYEGRENLLDNVKIK